MKRLSMIVLVCLFSVGVAFAQKSNGVNKSFIASFEKLDKYLQLTSHQKKDVYNINEYFIQAQQESLKSNPSRREKKMQNAVYGNLKLMKEVLTVDQYRKYLALINVTNNNSCVLSYGAMADVYIWPTNKF